LAYLLDANVFIDGKNRYYGLDFCPAFWDWLVRAHDAGSVLSVEAVRIELIGGSDDLAIWARQRPPSFFAVPDANSLPSLQAVSAWASTAGFEPAAVATFLQGADYYLVAQALAGGHTVVTHEVVATTTRRIKIPNACLSLGVPYLNPFEMLRSENARFVLPSP
jgi:hypothetical protein